MKRNFYFNQWSVFLLLVLFLCRHPVYAQETGTQKDKIEIRDFLEQVGKRNGWKFVYDPASLKGQISTESIEFAGNDLKRLNEVLKSLGVTARLVEGVHYAILPADPAALLSDTIKKSLNSEITGLVTDTSGSPLAGVTVAVKDRSNMATSTDLNGRYVLDAPVDAMLEYSMTGYKMQEVSAHGKHTINVILPHSGELGEVVVVAFGKQKKQEVVGAMTSINPSELKVPSSNLTTALAGRLAGVIAYQRSGEPGQDNADFFIRGVTTFGYKMDPLILIDGIELTSTDLARMQPDDIASFSIMKDATATALYGARGANGVILVTTKEGKEGKAKVTFRIESSMSKPTKDVELADPVTYMKLHNESVLTRDPLGILPYPQSKIDNTIAGKNPYMFPATDWRETLIKNQTINHRANLNVSGGGKVARYYIAGSYNKDNGVLKVDKRNNFNSNIDLKSYLIRSNVNISVTKTTEMVVRLHGSFDDYTGPIDGGVGMYRKIMRSNPVLFPAYYPANEEFRYVNHILFGNVNQGANFYINPYADMVKGYKDYSRSLMLAQFELKQDFSFLTPGLSFRALGNTNRQAYFDVSRSYSPFYYQAGLYNPSKNTYQLTLLNEASGKEYLDYNEGAKTVSSVFYLESALNYNHTFNRVHNLGALLVYNMRQSLDANSGDLQQSLPFRNIGLSGRATYSYDNKYFAEFNFGYNGSERFYKSDRFGFFPSVGAAWTVSNENFWKPVANTVTLFKLRATYGLVGNDAIGSAQDRFFYLSNVNMDATGKAFTFGSAFENVTNGISVSRYANTDITWESAAKMNLGLELSLFDRIKLTADYFTEHRRNILMSRASIPTTMGLQAAVKANVGEALGKGIDVSIDYQQHFDKNIWISALANFTYSSSKFKVYEEPEYNEPWLSRVGYPLSQQWGYIAERLFVDDYEANNSPRQNFGVYQGGDIKYRDINDDGQITTLDMAPIGHPTLPEIVYGFGFSAGYKNIDVSCFFQGLARESFWIDPKATAPFTSYRYQSEIDNNELENTVLQNQLLAAYANSHWSEDNPNIYALWPRLSSIPNENNSQVSTWFMQNGAFLRLKTVEIGYNLTGSTAKKLYMENLRFYVSGTNLFTLSKFNLWDVEMGSNGLGYPIQKVFNLGIRASF